MKKFILMVLLCFSVLAPVQAQAEKKVDVDVKVSIYGPDPGVIYVFPSKELASKFERLAARTRRYKMAKKEFLQKQYEKKLADFFKKNKGQYQAMKLDSRLGWLEQLGARLVKVNYKVE